MATIVVNKCAKKYKPDPELTIKSIIKKIPVHFLEDLCTIEIYDRGKKGYPKVRYIKGNRKEKGSRLEMYMESSTLSGVPFFSILEQNVHIINAINDHIEHNLKPRSVNKEILNYSTNRMNLNWAFLGVWQPCILIFSFSGRLINRLKIVKKIFSEIVYSILKRF